MKPSHIFIRQAVLLSAAAGMPFLAFAQTVTNLTTLFTFVMNILNTIVVPLIFALAFAIFIYNVYKYFIAGGGDEEKVKEGQRFVLWSVIGFAVMFSIWGLINLLVSSTGLDNSSRPAFPTFGTNGSVSSTSIFPNSTNSSVSGTNTGTIQNGYYTPPAGTSAGGVVNGVQQAGNSSSFLSNLVGNGTSGSNVFSTFWNNLTSNGGASTGNGLGQIQEGGICSNTTNNIDAASTDCAGNLACINGRCVVDPSLDSPGYGKGNGAVAPGGKCMSDPDCADQGSTSYSCINAVCAPDNGLGNIGDYCGNENGCNGNLYCAPNNTCQIDPSLDNNSGNGTNTTCTDGSVVPPGMSCSKCSDGSTTADTSLCPVSASVQCSDGSYVPDASLCPVAASVQCSDGSYADTLSQCPGGS